MAHGHPSWATLKVGDRVWQFDINPTVNNTESYPMGYTTEFTGSIALGRRLTMAEAKELLELADDAYFQWVPSADLGHIVWDEGEKFYNYVEQLQWLCGWLSKRSILANGILYWHGEEAGDTGMIIVSNNGSHHTLPKSQRPLGSNR